MGAKLTKGRLQWFCNIVSLALMNYASQNFPLWMFPVEVATRDNLAWDLMGKSEAAAFFYLNTRTVGVGTFISYMLLVYWLTLLKWNSRQAATAPPCRVSFFGFRYPSAGDMFSSMMKGAASPVTLPHITENRGLEMKRHQWKFSSTLLVSSGFPYFTLLFPCWLPALLTSGTSTRHESHKSSHNCTKSNSYNKSMCACVRVHACVCFYAGKCWTTSFPGEKAPISSICQFPLYKYSHSGHFELLVWYR